MIMIEKMRKAEKNLDLFWSIVDEHYTSNIGKMLDELLADILSPRELVWTSEWIESAVMSEKIVSSKMTDQFSTLNIEYRTKHTLEIDTASLKNKAKRRVLASESVSAEIEYDDVL